MKNYRFRLIWSQRKLADQQTGRSAHLAAIALQDGPRRYWQSRLLRERSAS